MSISKKRWWFAVLFLLVLSIPALAETETVYERFSRYFDKMDPGQNTVFVDIEKISIVRINLDILNTAYNVRVYLSTFSYNPSGLPLLDDVYHYHNLLITNLDISNIASASVEFRLPKDWMAENGIDENKVSMHRLVNNRWEEVQTDRIAEDISYVYYQSPLTGFSYLAITAKKRSSQVSEAPAQASQEGTSASQQAAEQEPGAEGAAGQAAGAEPAASQQAIAQSEAAAKDAAGKQKSFFSSKIFLLAVIVAVLGTIGAIVYLTQKEHAGHAEVDILVQDVNPGDFLKLADGTVLKNLYDLKDALDSINDNTFKAHVTADKNDFASWAEKALRDHPLSLGLKLKSAQREMADVVAESLRDLGQRQLLAIISKKYGLFPHKARELLESIENSRKRGASDRQIVEKLTSERYPRELVYDMVYGVYDDIEDIVIHPEDEAMIDKYVYEAMHNKHDFIETKLDLLEAGWPRFIVEKKMQQHFRKAIS